MDKGESAKKNFCDGYTCAQAVLMAFCKETGLNKKAVIKCTSALGGGLGGMREVCGAVSAMGIVLGAVYGSDKVMDVTQKRALYERVQQTADKFVQKNGSVVCRTLRGLKKGEMPQAERRNKEYYKQRPCPQLCADAAEILDEYIKEHPVNE